LRLLRATVGFWLHRWSIIGHVLLARASTVSTNSTFQDLPLLVLEPLLMPELPLFVHLLSLEVSFDFFKSLLLQDLLDFCSHSAKFFVLLQLVCIKVGILRQSLYHPQLVILLRC